MKPLQTDLSIFREFNFEHPPVGIKFLFEKPDGVEQLKKTLPLCQMICEAQEQQKPFYFTRENEDCFGTMALGMIDIPVFAEAGMIGQRLEIYQEARANQRIYQHVPTLTRGIVNYVVCAQLDVINFEPDLFVLMANTSQTEIVLRAMSYSTGELWESRKTSVLSCAWIYVYPYKTGKVNYMPTGMGFGAKAKEVFPEGWFLVSIPWDKLPLIIANLKEMDWVPTPYIEGREKYYEREGKIKEECFKYLSV